MNASELLVKALQAEGVEVVFGLPGEENLHFIEALRDHPTIKLVLVRHEQAGGFMAAAYWRLTGKIAVAYSTLGAGATNLTTPAAHAYLGGFPTLFITGQKPIRENRQGLYQLLDISSVMAPVVKITRTVESGADVAITVHEAFKEMRSGRPGPAHIELPEDVAKDETDGQLFPAVHAPAPVASDEAIEQALTALFKAKSPLFMLGAAAEGHGIPEAFRELAQRVKIPYFCTWMGKGVGDESDENFIGSITMPGMDYVGAAAKNADVILNIGHDIAEKAPFLMRPESGQIVIHVNAFPAHADHIYFPQHQVVGDITHTLRRMTEMCQGSHVPRHSFGALLSKLGMATGGSPDWDHGFARSMGTKMRASIARGADDAKSFPAKPQFLAAAARAALPADGIITLDNGVHKLWFTRNFPVSTPQCHLVDSALGSMGLALPAAIAAAIAYPDRAVLAVAGDGGFMMNAQELETAKRLELNIVVLILNDNGLGMIRMKQVMEGNSPFSVDFSNPDFVTLAEAHGATGYRLDNPAQLPEILESAFANGGLHVIDAPVDYRENVGLLKEMKMASASKG